MTRQQLQRRVSQLEDELDTADTRIEELESALSTVADAATEALPDEEVESGEEE